MPEPLAICLEDLDATDPDLRYLRCVALVGRRPGLRVDRRGDVTWCTGDEVGCELWVSADDRLMLFRPAGAVGVLLRRAGRSLDVPEERPVVALHQDSVEVGGRRLRLHVHGRAPSVQAPSPLRRRRAATAGLAAAMALAVTGFGDCGTEPPPEPEPTTQPATEPEPEPETPPIEVLFDPPDMVAPEELETVTPERNPTPEPTPKPTPEPTPEE